jgi:hypothetical protein
MTMVTGRGPQLNVMMPPFATAATTAEDVQLAAVPLPTTRVGRRVSTARASAGTGAPPPGFPAAGARVGVGSDFGAGALLLRGAGRGEAGRVDGRTVGLAVGRAVALDRGAVVDGDGEVDVVVSAGSVASTPGVVAARGAGCPTSTVEVCGSEPHAPTVMVTTSARAANGMRRIGIARP